MPSQLLGPRCNPVLGAKSPSSTKRRCCGRGGSADRHGQVPVPGGPSADVRHGSGDHQAGHVPSSVWRWSVQPRHGWFRLRRWRLCGEQATGEGEQRGDHRGQRWLQWHHSGGTRSGTLVSALWRLWRPPCLPFFVYPRLGCVHDGSPPPSYLGGPGATRCPWEDGFIMSDLRHTERGFRWSSCSVEQFKHFLKWVSSTPSLPSWSLLVSLCLYQCLSWPPSDHQH